MYNEALGWAFWVTSTLFIAGFLMGGGVPLLARWLPVARERLMTWAMRGSLAMALLGGGGTALFAAWVLGLESSVGLPAGTDPPTLQKTLWGGPRLIAGEIPSLALTLYMDPLAALLTILVGFFTVCVALYSFGWLAEDPMRATVAAGFNLFAWLTLVVLWVDNAFWLLVVLEFMSLSFGYLVLYRGRRGGDAAESRLAIRVYLITSHLSIMCIAVALLIMGVHYDSFDFKVFRENVVLFPLRNLVFILLLLGLGIRAGVTPFHFWVPIVHPQSPTTTHAFSLGVSIKVAIYLMIRFFLEFLGPSAWWWGALIVLLAGITALVNVFYALLSPDLKRALAYHSVENIGIILAGVGVALLFRSWVFSDLDVASLLAGLALMASLYHVINHALFKGLLYLGTGSIENRTATVVMDRLGGLLRRFPWTGNAFLVGAVAIAGFPPFNGFISEWLTVQALLAGAGFTVKAQEIAPLLVLFLLGALVLLGTSFALTALAFVKIVGETLLGLPRDREVAQRTRRGDVPWSMRLSKVILAFLCLFLGVAPFLLVPWLCSAVAGVGLASTALVATPTGLTVQVGASPLGYRTELSSFPLWTLLVLPLLAIVAAAVWRRYVPARRSRIWAGGEVFRPEVMQYTGSAFCSLVWEVAATTKAQDAARDPLPVAIRLSRRRAVPEMFHRWFNRGVRGLLRISQKLGNALQGGDIRAYLLYIFLAFIGVLVLLAVLSAEMGP